MAAMVWDQTGSRWYETGVSKVGLFTKGEEGKWVGVPWNGVTGITESPDGAELSDIYADDIKYASLRSAETFGATIEAYTYPDEFAECDGSAEPVSGVMLGQQTRKAFCLVYKTKVGNDTQDESDDGYKLHIIYNATASPSEKAYATVNDSPEAITFSWEINTTPLNVTGFKTVSTITIDSRRADKTKLATLEKTIYGSESSEPTLPEPDDLLTAMGYTAE